MIPLLFQIYVGAILPWRERYCIHGGCGRSGQAGGSSQRAARAVGETTAGRDPNSGAGEQARPAGRTGWKWPHRAHELKCYTGPRDLLLLHLLQGERQHRYHAAVAHLPLQKWGLHSWAAARTIVSRSPLLVRGIRMLPVYENPYISWIMDCTKTLHLFLEIRIF